MEKFSTNLLVLLVVVIFVESGRGIHTPSLYGSLGSIGAGKSEVGLAVALLSVGRLSGAVILGWWSDKRGDTSPIRTALILAITGSIMYVIAILQKWVWMVIASRLLVGAAGGVISVARAHVARITHNQREKRLYFISMISVCQFFGIAVSPLLGAVHYSSGAVFNDFTAPGFLLIGLNGLGLILLVAYFVDNEPDDKVYSASEISDTDASSVTSYDETAPLAAEEREQRQTIRTRKKRQLAIDTHLAAARADVADNIPYHSHSPTYKHAEAGVRRRHQEAQDAAAAAAAKKSTRALYWAAVAVFLFLNFSSRAVLTIIETVGAVRSADIYHIVDKQEQVIGASLFFGLLGVFGLICFLSFLSFKVPSERVLLLSTLLIMLIGSMIMFLDDAPWAFYVGCALVWSMSVPILQATAVSAFAHELSSEEQGTMMGVFSIAGSSGRIIFAVVAGYFSINVSFAIAFFITATGWVAYAGYLGWKRTVESAVVQPGAVTDSAAWHAVPPPIESESGPEKNV
jgi:MFS family permease